MLINLLSLHSFSFNGGVHFLYPKTLNSQNFYNKRENLELHINNEFWK